MTAGASSKRASSAAASFAAVDLGASSARVVLGHVGADTLAIEQVHRSPNRPVRIGGRLYSDVLDLYRATLIGLRAAARTPLTSIGIDSWAVDYGLLDAEGTLLANPTHYRDERAARVLDDVLDQVPAEELYRITGIQLLPINTVFQLYAARETVAARAAHRMALIPDLIGYWLTGEIGAEITNASTTQLLDIRTQTWSHDLMDRLGLDAGLLPPLLRPGRPLGTLRTDVAAETGIAADVPVVAVGSHDTASAVVGVPATDDAFAYISCGTWSLVGVELDRPVLTEQSRIANFTNEGGVDGTVRYLRNVGGLWLLQESERTWRAAGWEGDLGELLRAAAAVPALRAVVDVDAPEFLPPGDMPARIAKHCARTGQPVPSTPAETVRCVLDSLALAYRRALEDARRLSGKDVSVVHMVGGGAHNELLCRLTADASGLPVVAGPTEATAIGNLLVQARAAGVLRGGLDRLRRLVRETQHLRHYAPSTGAGPWKAAEARLSPTR